MKLLLTGILAFGLLIGTFAFAPSAKACYAGIYCDDYYDNRAYSRGYWDYDGHYVAPRFYLDRYERAYYDDDRYYDYDRYYDDYDSYYGNYYKENYYKKSYYSRFWW